MARDLGVQFNATPTQSSQPTTKGEEGLGVSAGMLTRSQGALDQIHQKALQQQADAQAQTSPMNIAKGTASGVVGQLLTGPVRALRSGVDFIGEKLTGQKSPGEFTGFSGEPVKTYQGELASGTSPLAVGGEGALDVASMLPVGKGISAAKSLFPKAAEAVSKLASPITKPIASYLAQRAEKKGLDASIEAVYNNPTGAKFKRSSSQVLSGQRDLTPASVFKEQGLTPDQQSINLGTRLKDLKLGKDPVKNTQILADDFAATEDKLQKALTGDPEVKYLADKQTLFGTLEKVKTESPQEFRIKDSQSMINRVVDFANKTINQADDSIGGVREARKSFDLQAKREFPSAFKPDGTIDTKTASGYAIKKVRDDINEHLYNTAPNGSEIQGLIGREADLYKAAQVSFEKATKGQGKNAIQQWIKENPKKAQILGYGAAAVGGAKVYDLAQ